MIAFHDGPTKIFRWEQRLHTNRSRLLMAAASGRTQGVEGGRVSSGGRGELGLDPAEPGLRAARGNLPPERRGGGGWPS